MAHTRRRPFSTDSSVRYSPVSPLPSLGAASLKLKKRSNGEEGHRQLPHCIAVGVGRSGTTWLHQVLAGHVGLPYGVKETDFFLRKYSNGIDWYKSFFRDCAAEFPILEICPT